MTQLPYIVFRQTAPEAAIKMNDTKKIGFHTQIGRITQPYNREITGLNRMHIRWCQC